MSAGRFSFRMTLNPTDIQSDETATNEFAMSGLMFRMIISLVVRLFRVFFVVNTYATIFGNSLLKFGFK